jgi:sugar/nucleoside kinase (ribokinase family)
MQRLSYNPLTRVSGQGQEPHSLGVIGHLAIDTIEHTNFQLNSSPGGSAAAIATASVQLGIYTTIHCKVGKNYPKEWLRVLKNLGVDISPLEFSDNEESLHIKFKYNEKHILQGMECNDRALTGLKIDTLPRTECVHICPAQPQDQAELVQRTKGGNRKLSISFSDFFIDDYKKKDFLDVFKWKDVDLVFLNEKQARAMTNEEIPEEMAHTFHKEGVKIVTITLGEKGSLVSDDKNIRNMNARDVEIIDPTGYMDSYIGGFLGQYLISNDIKKAAGIGMYMASLTAQKKGSWAALLSDVGRF